MTKDLENSIYKNSQKEFGLFNLKKRRLQENMMELFNFIKSGYKPFSLSSVDK